MATKRKSIIEEALLEAKSLEDALKANTKEMLASHMKEEIENIVESSLNEEDEEEVEELDINVEGSDEEMEEMPAEAGEDSEESELMDLEIDLDALAVDDDEEVELDVAELPIELDMGDEEELDLTGASDEEVIAVFKKMSDEDEVEVVKDADGIHLTDNETGAEYYIKEQHELDDVEEGYDLDEDEDGLCEGCGSKSMDEDDDVVYEIELEEDDKYGQGSHEYRRHNVDGVEKRSGEGPEVDGHRHFKDYMGEDETIIDLDEEEVDESTRRTLADRRRRDLKPSNYPTNESRNPRTSKNVKKVSESKIMKEYKELKSKNEEYKGALKVFKNKLNEVALFNTNLAYVNRLFTEHSTTKSEKMEILKRFDNAESIKESKSIYKSVKSELDTKSPITESVENKVNKTVKSSKSDLNESTAYVDPQITAIKDLMRKLS